MNPVPYQNNPGGPGAMPQQPAPPPGDGQGGQIATAQQNEERFKLLLKRVLQRLHSQGPFGGWQESVAIQERANKIYQL